MFAPPDSSWIGGFGPQTTCPLSSVCFRAKDTEGVPFVDSTLNSFSRAEQQVREALGVGPVPFFRNGVFFFNKIHFFEREKVFFFLRTPDCWSNDILPVQETFSLST